MRVYMPMNLPSSPPDDAIKVISFNSAGFVYNINCDNPFEQLTDYLRQSKADILCIQEDNNGKQKMTDFYNSLYPYNDTVKVNTSKSSPTTWASTPASPFCARRSSITTPPRTAA